jgi:hypothetical protein
LGFISGGKFLDQMSEYQLLKKGPVAGWQLISYITNSVKGKVIAVLFLTQNHAMRAYRGGGGTAPRIIYLGIKWS